MKMLRLAAIAAMLLCCVGMTAETHKPETPDSFRIFLEQSLKTPPAGTADVEAFYERALTFWNDHVPDFEEHSDRYQSLLSLYYKYQTHYPLDTPDRTNIERFRPAIDTFKELDARNTMPAHPILFVGSSSIVSWETARAFPSYPVVNRGFGGSTIAEVNHFYDDVVKKYHPAVIVMYCDHEVYDYLGDTAALALQRFEEFATRVSHDLPQTPLLFISMKPTPVDAVWGEHVRDNAERANRLIKSFISRHGNMRFVDITRAMFQDGKLRNDIFLPDLSTHMNAKGYALWNQIVGQQLAEVYRPVSEEAQSSRERAH